MKLLFLLIAIFYVSLIPGRPFYIIEPAAESDIVINEILFNPKPMGVDYVEIYNKSEKTINLQNLYIANRNASSAISSKKPLSTQTRFIEPGEYLVLTEDAAIVQQQYLAKDPDAFLQLSSMPSFPDAGGTVVLLNEEDTVIDEVKYDEKWQFKLLVDNEGIALERINVNKPSQDPNNWQSAATDVGYGTPSYKNSQYYNYEQPNDALTVEPAVFSPDNDGYNDFTLIKYKFPEPGYVCTITLFTISGTPVRYLQHNALCGVEGFFKWDGLDEKGQALGMGNYILLTEVFNLQGKTKKYKNVITIAKRLK